MEHNTWHTFAFSLCHLDADDFEPRDCGVIVHLPQLLWVWGQPRVMLECGGWASKVAVVLITFPSPAHHPTPDCQVRRLLTTWSPCLKLVSFQAPFSLIVCSAGWPLNAGPSSRASWERTAEQASFSSRFGSKQGDLLPLTLILVCPECLAEGSGERAVWLYVSGPVGSPTLEPLCDHSYFCPDWLCLIKISICSRLLEFEWGNVHRTRWRNFQWSAFWEVTSFHLKTCKPIV